MNAKIFSFVRLSENSNVASVKLAMWLSELLGIPTCWDETVADEPLDRLVIVGGAFGFAGTEVLESLGRAIEQAGLVLWIQQDYTIIPPKDESGAESPFRAAFRNRFQRTGEPSVSFWTTVKNMSMPGKAKSGHRCGDHSRYVNWNALAYRPYRDIKPMSERAAGDTLLYYGSYRKDRERYFDRYLRTTTVPTIFCTLSKKTFEALPAIARHKTTDIYQYAGEFGLGLYLEDPKSHVEYHSPANRFYEMMSCGLPMVFQPEAVRMLRDAGYNVGDYTVNSPSEFPALMERRGQIWLEQQQRWAERARGEVRDLEVEVRAAWESLP